MEGFIIYHEKYDRSAPVEIIFFGDNRCLAFECLTAWMERNKNASCGEIKIIQGKDLVVPGN